MAFRVPEDLRQIHADKIRAYASGTGIAMEIFYGDSSPDNYAVVLKDGRFIDFKDGRQGTIEEGAFEQFHKAKIHRDETGIFATTDLVGEIRTRELMDVTNLEGPLTIDM